MVLNAYGVEVPLGSDDFDPDGDMTGLATSLGARMIIPVANATAQAALVTAHAPTTSKPLWVYRVDLDEIQYTTNGTKWRSPGAGPHVSVVRAATQSIPDSTFTAIAWDTELVDTDGMWVPASQTRLTCARSGTYLLTASAAVNAIWGGRVGVAAIRSGSNIAMRLRRADDSVAATVSKQITMTVGQWIEIHMFQNSGAARNTFTSLDSRPNVELTWLRS